MEKRNKEMKYEVVVNGYETGVTLSEEEFFMLYDGHDRERSYDHWCECSYIRQNIGYQLSIKEQYAVHEGESWISYDILFTKYSDGLVAIARVYETLPYGHGRYYLETVALPLEPVWV